MPRPDSVDDGRDIEPEEELEVEIEEDDEPERRVKSGKGSSGGKKRSRSAFIDDSAIEDDEDDEEEDDDDDDDYGGRGARNRKKRRGSQFFELEATVNSDDDEEEEDEGEDDFIVDNGADIGEERSSGRRERRPSFMEEHEDVDEIERKVKERYRYAKSSHADYADDATDVEQQALLPSVKDPKLWMVKCAIGHEREVAICLMQKYINIPNLHIRSVIALDHLKNYIYVEAEKEAHVKEVCKGLRNIYSLDKIKIVPIKEMTDVLSVESKAVDLARDTWVRMKIGVYKGDLAKVLDVDNVRQRVTVELIPRIDLQMLANKLDGREVPKKKSFAPPPRFLNVEEARQLNIRVERKRGRGRDSREYFDMVQGLKFKDGFLHKTVSSKSISVQNIQPTFDELEKFRKPGGEANGDAASLSTLFANRKKGHFMKGDPVIVVRGDLKNLEGWVVKVEEDIVHVKPKTEGLPKILAFNEKELCKYFKPGDHVKAGSGVHEGATGMVVKVEGHVLIILSDTTKEHIRVFADHVVESSEIATGVTRIGDYELHDLVLLDNMSFCVIVRVESEGFQVLKGVPDRPEVVHVKLREIKNKIDKRTNATDRFNNLVSAKDIVRVVEGPLKGKQGPVEHIHKGILFIHDRHHHEHGGFICARSQSVLLVGGSNNRRGNDSRFGGMSSSSSMQPPSRFPPREPYSRFGDGGRFGGASSSSSVQPPSRLPPREPCSRFGDGGRFGGGGRGGGHGNELVGKSIKIKSGPYKGYRGRVTEVKGVTVRVELDSQMKNITVSRDQIADTNTTATPFRETVYSLGGETPMHPMHDPSATPIHDGMRTPMHSPAWHPTTPRRDNWDDADPGSSASSQVYRPGTPYRPYEASTPGGNYNPSTHDGRPMTPGNKDVSFGRR